MSITFHFAGLRMETIQAGKVTVQDGREAFHSYSPAKCIHFSCAVLLGGGGLESWQSADNGPQHKTRTNLKF